ncbi:vitellin-degrading protease-like [Condylostylus longicornis]|uniref:vitellin-degrading protease-like n=1 Tax=Condylostylus longicornis TaxID=2530218 RepID=UPI00244E0B7F|nr:vitellin-degrading protease-like [Condylostylus longicornis]
MARILLYITFILFFTEQILSAYLSPHGGSARIIGGTDSTIEEIPWQVSILYYTINHCGGSIINEDTVLTASHCFHSHGTDPESFSVRVGTNRRSGDGQILKVKKIIPHPEFNIKTYNHDIAIVKLKDKLKFNDKIQPIELSEITEILPVGEFGIASGFGLLSFDKGGFPTILQKVNLKVLDQTVCQRKYEKVNRITEFMFCAGGDGIHDACGGDSGGPFVVNKTLVGVISHAIKCALEEYPGVFARVSTHRDWIDENI